MAQEIPHKGGRTFGYRVKADGLSLAYLPDHHPSTSWKPGLELARGVDVLCHGAMFTSAEKDIANAYGHATVDEALRLAQDAGAGRLVLIHHSPRRTDNEVEALAEGLKKTDVAVVVGREGDVVMGR